MSESWTGWRVRYPRGEGTVVHDPHPFDQDVLVKWTDGSQTWVQKKHAEVLQ